MKLKTTIVLLGLVSLAALATATPLACTSSCSISAATTGYKLPVFEIQAGVPLVWHSTDIGHIQRDGATGNSCLGVPVSGGADSDSVVFTIANGALSASIAGGASAVCTNAVASPDGSFALPYYCAIHSTMRGALVVSP